MKSTTPTFTVELPLRVDDKNERFLTNALDLGWSIYNAALRTALDNLKRMRESSSWKEACAMPEGPERTRLFMELHRKYGLTEYGLMAIANKHRKASGRDQLGAHEAQCIGKAVWGAIERYLFKNEGKPRFKRRKHGLNSISGTDNHEIIYRPKKQEIYWRKHHLPIIWEETPWLRAALNEGSDPARPRRVKFCRIIRHSINGRKRWYVELCVEGVPPTRYNYAPVSEVMGIDPGPNKIAYFHPQEAGIKLVAPNVDMKAAEIRRLQRQMDRSRRASNPDNYEDDGQVKKGARKWRESNRYARLRTKLREFHRKTAATRKRDHGTLINQLLQRAGTIKIEKNSYKSYQRNFGRSTQRSGMGEFVQHLKSRAASAGCVVIELNPYVLKLSQYDPPTDTYIKKPLKQRWHPWGGEIRTRSSSGISCPPIWPAMPPQTGMTEASCWTSGRLRKRCCATAVCAENNLVRSRPSPDVPTLTSPMPLRAAGTGKRSVANSESAGIERDVLPPQGRIFRKIWYSLTE